MKIRVNRGSLEESIKLTILRAEAWPRNMSGECQLYGIFDDDGIIRKFFVADFVGHNSWEQGDHIVHIHTQRWYDILDGENMPELLEGEFENNDELRARFERWLDEQGIDYDNPADEWHEFERFDKSMWEALISEWKEIAIDNTIGDMVDVAINHLYEGEKWHITDDAPEAEISFWADDGVVI